MVGRGKEGTRDSSERVARLGGGFFRLAAAISEGLASTFRPCFLPGPAPCSLHNPDHAELFIRRRTICIQK